MKNLIKESVKLMMKSEGHIRFHSVNTGNKNNHVCSQNIMKMPSESEAYHLPLKQLREFVIAHRNENNCRQIRALFIRRVQQLLKKEKDVIIETLVLKDAINISGRLLNNK